MDKPTPLLVVALLLSLPAHLQAQADSLSRVLDGLPGDRPVRVELWTEAGGTEELVGRVPSQEARSFTMVTDDGVRRPGHDRVRRLWVEEGRHGGRGAWMGALIGGGAGAVTGTVLMIASDTRELTPSPVVLTGLLSAASAGLGTLVGYAVGWQQRDWRLRFDAGDRRVGLRVEVPVP